MHPNLEEYTDSNNFYFIILIVNILVGRCKLVFNYV